MTKKIPNPSKEMHTRMIDACMKSDFEEIIFCFKSGYELISNDINLFSNMCNHAPVDTIKFLWDNQKKLNYEIDVHYNDDEAFKYACWFKKIDNVAYLIFNHDIEKTPNIKAFLDSEEFDIKQDIIRMISLKELNKKLEKELITNDSLKNKFKL